MLFTASTECYARKISQWLDPSGTVIKMVCSRQYCIKEGQEGFRKDLRVLSRGMSQVLIVDNFASCYSLQPHNGIPIVPFTGDKNDIELLLLLEYLEYLKASKDPIGTNSEYFAVDKMLKTEDLSEAVKIIMGIDINE